MKRRKNGEGTISRLPSGKYRMKKQVGFLSNGKPRVLTVTDETVKGCIKQMDAREKEFESENPLAADESNIKKITLTDLCLEHLKYDVSIDALKPSSANRREDTIMNQIDKYPIGMYQAMTVTSQDIVNHIERLIKEGRVSVSSIDKATNVINAAYKWAKNQGFAISNPCVPVWDRIKSRIDKLKIKNSSDGYVLVLSEQQVELLKAYAEKAKESGNSYRYRSILGMMLLINTAMRVGELCALRWKDYDEKNGVIMISKTRNVIRVKDPDTGKNKYIPNENAVKNYHARTIALEPDAIEVLSEIKRVSSNINPDDYILLSKSNNPTTPRLYDKRINEYLVEAGLPSEVSGAHIFRRTLATKMYKDGARVEDIAAYLGDRPETILAHYISLTQRIVSDGEVINVVRFPGQK